MELVHSEDGGIEKSNHRTVESARADHRETKPTPELQTKPTDLWNSKELRRVYCGNLVIQRRHENSISQIRAIWDNDWNEEELEVWFMRRWVEAAQEIRKRKLICFSPLHWFGDL